MGEEYGAVVFIGWMALAVGVVWLLRRLVAAVLAWRKAGRTFTAIRDDRLPPSPDQCYLASRSPASAESLGTCRVCRRPIRRWDYTVFDDELELRHASNVELAEARRAES